MTIQVLADRHNPRETWVRTRFSSLAEAALVMAYAFNIELRGHKWMRGMVKASANGRGKACSLTLVCEHRNARLPRVTEETLRAVMAAAAASASVGPTEAAMESTEPPSNR